MLTDFYFIMYFGYIYHAIYLGTAIVRIHQECMTNKKKLGTTAPNIQQPATKEINTFM